jgi:DNA-directed RNA polymerase subunit RPC12/RpoP
MGCEACGPKKMAKYVCSKCGKEEMRDAEEGEEVKSCCGQTMKKKE